MHMANNSIERRVFELFALDLFHHALGPLHPEVGAHLHQHDLVPQLQVALAVLQEGTSRLVLAQHGNSYVLELRVQSLPHGRALSMLGQALHEDPVEHAARLLAVAGLVRRELLEEDGVHLLLLHPAVEGQHAHHGEQRDEPPDVRLPVLRPRPRELLLLLARTLLLGASD